MASKAARKPTPIEADAIRLARKTANRMLDGIVELSDAVDKAIQQFRKDDVPILQCWGLECFEELEARFSQCLEMLESKRTEAALVIAALTNVYDTTHPDSKPYRLCGAFGSNAHFLILRMSYEITALSLKSDFRMLPTDLAKLYDSEPELPDEPRDADAQATALFKLIVGLIPIFPVKARTVDRLSAVLNKECACAIKSVTTKPLKTDAPGRTVPKSRRRVTDRQEIAGMMDKAGYSGAKIGEALNCTKQAVSRLLQRYRKNAPSGKSVAAPFSYRENDQPKK